MKMLRLRIAGFGPFKTEQVVDFERFDADGIFLITGKTGAGKSSILDAICFALYGRVPRYDGTELQLRSDHAEPEEPSFVQLDFRLNESDYRVYRTPKYDRPKKRGGGMTTSLPQAKLWVRNADGQGSGAGAAGGDGVEDADGWTGIAARPVDVGMELAEILPLKEDQFLQVILLAQNRFQKFLLAKTEERRVVLRTLFRTVRFEQFESNLISRRKALDEQLAGVQQGIADRARSAASALRLDEADVLETVDLPWFEAGLLQLATELAEVTAACEESAVDLARASDVHQTMLEAARRQERRAAATIALRELDELREQIADTRLSLAEAARAARVWPQLREREQAEIDLARTLDRESEARADWELHRDSDDAAPENDGAAKPDGAAPETDDGLAVRIDDLLGRLATLAEALADEEKLPGLDTALADLTASVAAAQQQLQSVERRVQALPALVDVAVDDQTLAALAAAALPGALAALEQVTAGLAAAHAAVRSDEELQEAARAEIEASRENTAAAARYELLLERRFAGHASELAAQLVAGEPCLVCGSTVHPLPGTGDEVTVTEDDLDQARLEMARHQQELAQASALVQQVTPRVAEARSQSGGRSTHEWHSEQAPAAEAVALARQAEESLAGLAGTVAKLRTELADSAQNLTLMRTACDEGVIALATLRSQRQTLADRVQLRRGSETSIAAQVSTLQARLESARALANALRSSSEQRNSLDAALARVAAQLTEEGFASAAQAEAARVPATELQAREESVRRHDDERAAVTAVLAEIDLAEAEPAEPGLTRTGVTPVDTEPTALLLAAAQATRDTLLGSQSSLEERHSQLGLLVRDAQAGFASSADLLTARTQVRQLADVVHGDEPNTRRMRLETYVLAAQLEEIVAAANTRLRTMTSGRYSLEHDDTAEFRGAKSGLGLAILDSYTGRTRAPVSLSGGETFLASLALALGLADVVTSQAGGVSLDTLFVDEGFGSLDGETLETAMAALDTLRAGGRTIGLISHVESMKEQIPAKLGIRVTDQGHSIIEAG